MVRSRVLAAAASAIEAAERPVEPSQGLWDAHKDMFRLSASDVRLVAAVLAVRVGRGELHDVSGIEAEAIPQQVRLYLAARGLVDAMRTGDCRMEDIERLVNDVDPPGFPRLMAAVVTLLQLPPETSSTVERLLGLLVAADTHVLEVQ